MSVGYEDRNVNRRTDPAGNETADWDDLKSDVGDIAGVAIERGRHFLDTARHQATDYVDRRKGDMAQSVADLAGSLRESTSSFDDRPNIKAFVDSAAEGLEQLADSIRQRSFPEIYSEVEDVMRRRPVAVAAVSVALGFLAARFIKASSEGRNAEMMAAERRHQASERMRRGASQPSTRGA
ncbi:hypothetical protein [Microvirga massiliensis]|uniref:hypothetical protein n=1 Tax=Microvirga massiliensis TaxID=1033741 RepID=UPI00062BA338|nr:hypothetical protein [Microvirga massiliensis]